jgi:hypothetical protein
MSTAQFRDGQGGMPPKDNSPENDIGSIRSTTVFKQAIVIDTLNLPSQHANPPVSLREDQKLEFYRAPRNSLVCRLLTAGQESNSDLLCFPFFSSHFSLPVKVGERVWLIQADPFSETGGEQHYWMSRVCDIDQVEDVNFTSFSRSTDISGTFRQTVSPESRTEATEYAGILENEPVLTDLLQFVSESSAVKLEPIPRLTKRPGDMCVQGSNNAAIILGTDRGWDFVSRPSGPSDSNALPTSPIQNGSAAIDIVTGRGRYFKSPDELISRTRKADAAKGLENSTQPFIVRSQVGEYETDKNPAPTQDIDQNKSTEGEGGPATPGNHLTNPTEGDPDFLVDASRIYVSEKSDIDSRLGLTQIRPKGFLADFEPQTPGPCIAVKSDHVRIVARKVPLQATDGKLPEGFESANGSIRIVKEGNPNEDLASIFIEPDGTIQISGSKIFLGRTSDDGGAGGGPGDGDSQPYVKYQQLEDLWNETMDALDKFCQTLITHVTPGFGSPSPQITQAATELKATIASSLKQNIQNIKSERIFGE